MCPIPIITIPPAVEQKSSSEDNVVSLSPDIFLNCFCQDFALDEGR